MQAPLESESTKTNAHVEARLFPSYAGPGVPQRAAYLAIAVGICAFEVLDGVLQLPNAALTCCIVIVFSALLAAAGWLAPQLEIAYLVAFFIAEMSGWLADASFPSLGLYTIAASWLARSWILPGFIVLCGNAALIIYETATLEDALTMASLPFTLALAIGLALFWQNRRYAHTASKAAEYQHQALNIEEQTRQQLAGELHDTVAKDLARLAISARRIADTPAEATPKALNNIAEFAESASKRIRPVILNLNTQHTNSSIMNTLASASRLLATRSITLVATIDKSVDEQLPCNIRVVASLFVREGATNILKYAPEGTEAVFDADLNGDTLFLFFANEINPRHALPAHQGLTGGFGLTNLAHRIETEGGSFSCGSLANQWLVNAELPIEKGQSL